MYDAEERVEDEAGAFLDLDFEEILVSTPEWRVEVE